MSKIRILIVEDDAITARDLERTLCNFGYEVTAVVSNGKQAFKSAQENPTDLVLMDIILDSEQNGIEAARQIRSCLNIPIVYITAYSDEKILKEARVSDPFGFIIKPIDEKELHAAIEIAISKHALQQKLEKALRESKERYSMLIENMNEGITMVDENGIIRYVNNHFLEIHGYTLDEIMGHPVTDFLDGSHLETFKKQIAIRKKGKRESYELMWISKEGRKIYTIVSPKPIYDEEGNFKGSIAVITDITERRQIEEELLRSHSKLRRLSQHLQSVKEEESKRISREIHDELGQALTALKIDLSLISKRLTEIPKNKKNLLQRIRSMSALIDKTVLMVQQISSELRPGVLDDLGLIPAIEWQIQDFQARTRIKCEMALDSFNFDITPECSTAIFRSLQEALTNVARHAQATKVGVSLKVMMDKLMLKITDNGKGISEADILSPESLGILGVRERILPFDGELELKGAPNKGTTVSIAIPIDKLCVKEDIK